MLKTKLKYSAIVRNVQGQFGLSVNGARNEIWKYESENGEMRDGNR